MRVSYSSEVDTENLCTKGWGDRGREVRDGVKNNDTLCTSGSKGILRSGSETVTDLHSETECLHKIRHKTSNKILFSICQRVLISD